MRRLLVVGGVLAALLALAVPPAVAKDYHIAGARVEVEIASDGTLFVTEHISFDFNGSFSGAYRDIPVRSGESVLDVIVAEGSTVFTPGASTELGSSGAPNSYGVEDLGSRVRVVWHYSASDEVRTFSVSYRMTGLAVAYDDVVDVNLQVWGDEWKVDLDQIEAVMSVPGSPNPGEVRVWGHPASVQGFTEFDADGVTPTLYAVNVAPATFVEMRVVFPRTMLTSTAGATVHDGPGLDGILAEEEAEIARGDAAGAVPTGVRNSVLAVLLLLIPIPFGVAWGYARFGNEPAVDYDREYEQEPPSDHLPAIVGALVSQGRAEEAAFTATLFDLIRKGVFTAEPVSVERSTWGGLKHEQISDLQIGLGDTKVELREFERHVVTIIERVLEDGPKPLHEFRKSIREDAAANHATYQSFRTAVGEATQSAGLLDLSGRVKGPAVLMGLTLVVAAIAWLVGPTFVEMVTGAANQTAFHAGVVVVAVFAFMVFGGLSAFRRLWVRRSASGALLAARWGRSATTSKTSPG